LAEFFAGYLALAGAFDKNGFGVVEETLEHGGGDCAIAVEDGSPLFEGFVGGKDDRTALVVGLMTRKSRFGSALVDGKIANLVEEQ
jgi:hypothetical protein